MTREMSTARDDVNCTAQDDAQQVAPRAVQRWFVYMVECRDGTLYTGVTTDLARRVAEHNESARGARYTRSRRPVNLICAREAASRSAALREEARIKRLTRSQKLKLAAELQEGNVNNHQA